MYMVLQLFLPLGACMHATPIERAHEVKKPNLSSWSAVYQEEMAASEAVAA